MSDALARVVARVRSLWRGLSRRSDVESEMREEFRHHIEMRTADLVRAGVPPKEASRRAHLEFGHIEEHRDEARGAIGLRRLDRLGFSLLDFKLALRMLVRYPGLTFMGTLAMAMGITFGAGLFEFGSQWIAPDLRFADGGTPVGIVLRDLDSGQFERRSTQDFVVWREELRSIEELGAIRLVPRNLSTGERAGEPVYLAEMSASAFRLVGTPPLLGRTLQDADEAVGAPMVVVLGFDLWRERFGGAIDVIGRTVRLDAGQATVVGVMPEGFEFPHSQNIWAPLRTDPFQSVGGGMAILVFGRLAPGVTMAGAQAELETMTLQAAVLSEKPVRLRAEVIPFSELVFEPAPGFFDPEFFFINLFVVAFLVLLCANVALLLFARAATREAELLVRNALGAGRSRIIVQLFSEALVLGGLAAAVGLVGARYGFEWFLVAVEGAEGPMPFWFVPRISTLTIGYAVGLTILGAVVAGVLPALKVTRGISGRLRASAAGGGGLRFGGVWTFVIVTQIALTIPLPGLAFSVVDEMVGLNRMGVAIATQDFLATRIEFDNDGLSFRSDEEPFAQSQDSGSPNPRREFRARYASALDELERRLLAEPGVQAVTFVDRLPLTYHPYHQIEMDEGAVPPPDDRGHRVGTARVELDYFDALSTPVLDGRAFDSEDVVAGSQVVMVDQPFVDRVLGGRRPIGLRLRYVRIEGAPPLGPESPWYEVVGVVGDLGLENGFGRGGVYHPAVRGDIYPANLLLSVRENPAAFSSRLREVAADVDPALRLQALLPLEQVTSGEVGVYAWGVSAVLLVTVLGLMLSLAGIYAAMSFAVSRRTREIGIRIALGSRPTALVLATLRSPLVQLGLGVLAGACLSGLLTHWSFGGFTPGQALVVFLYSLAMAGVCLLACVVPTRRALRIQPVDALRMEG